MTAMFPSALAAQASAILAVLERDKHHSLDRSFDVVLGAERLVIPERVYYPTELLDRLDRYPAEQRAIINCIFTRHDDGRIRERALRGVVRCEYAWVVPFVVRLVGEYVVEILDVILDDLDALSRDTYAAFLSANPAFYFTTKQRVVSYWDCYYRWKTPRFEVYAGAKIIARLDEWVKTSAR